MIGKIFGKKEPELVLSDESDEEPRRPRFRRTRSAASESVYADYLSDDWGDAPTIHVDRDGREIHSRSPSDDLEDWQRGGGMLGGVAARMRSLSFSKPNWNRAPPPAVEDQYRFGWADRVERAGGRDERQEKRDEDRSRRPVAMPVPNPAPGPINVRRDEDPPGLGVKPPPGVPLRPPAEGAPAQTSTKAPEHPGLSRRATRASNRPTERTKIIHPDRSTTSSPTVIPHKDIGSGKPGHRRHLSRVEKIAAVFQHVASLPFLADTPVQTYYPPKEKAVVPPTEPFHTYDPTVPKRYRPPPPMPPCWYQPKPPKQKKPKKVKEKKGNKGKTAIANGLDDFAIYDDEFEYPDFQEGYTGYTPTLQSDPTTDDTETLYEQPRMIQDVSFAQHSMRPAFFPGPIKSTGLTTQQQPDTKPAGPRIYPENPRIYPHDPRVYPYDPDSYTEDSGIYSEDSRYYADDPHYYPDDYPDDYPAYLDDPHMYPPGPHPDMFPGVPYPGMYYHGPPPNDHPVGPLPATQTPGPRRLQIAAEPWESSSSSSSSRGPIPSPLTTAGARTVHARTPVIVPLDMPESVSGVTAAGPPLVIPTPTGTRKAMPERTPKGRAGPLPGGYSPAQPFAKHYEAYTPPKKGKGPSPRIAQGHTPKSRVRSPEEFYYVPPQGRKPSPLGGKGSSKGHGPSPHLPFGASPQGPYGPSPQFPYGPPPFPYGPSPQYTYGPSPQAPYGPSPQAPYGPSPQTGYGPSPQTAFSQAPQYVWTWGAPPYGEIPPPPHIPGDSPPPIPSPIATSTARSRSSRR